MNSPMFFSVFVAIVYGFTSVKLPVMTNTCKISDNYSSPIKGGLVCNYAYSVLDIINA